MSNSSSAVASSTNSDSGAPTVSDDTSLSRTSDNCNEPSDDVSANCYFISSPSDNSSSDAELCSPNLPQRREKRRVGKKRRYRHNPSERGLGARCCLRCCGLGTISSYCRVCDGKGEVYVPKFKGLQDCEPCYGTGTVRDEKACKRCTGDGAFFFYPQGRTF